MRKTTAGCVWVEQIKQTITPTCARLIDEFVSRDSPLPSSLGGSTALAHTDRYEQERAPSIIIPSFLTRGTNEVKQMLGNPTFLQKGPLLPPTHQSVAGHQTHSSHLNNPKQTTCAACTWWRSSCGAAPQCCVCDAFCLFLSLSGRQSSARVVPARSGARMQHSTSTARVHKPR